MFGNLIGKPVFLHYKLEKSSSGYVDVYSDSSR